MKGRMGTEMDNRTCGPVGTVLEVSGRRARVRIDRQAACEGCRACGILMGTGELIVDAEAPFEISPGDRVTLESDGAGMLKSAALAYMLPLTGFLAGLGGATIAGMSEVISLGCGVVGLSLAYLAAHLADKRSLTPCFRLSSIIENR